MSTWLLPACNNHVNNLVTQLSGMSQQSQDSTGTLVQDVPTIKGYAGSTGTHVEVFKIIIPAISGHHSSTGNSVQVSHKARTSWLRSTGTTVQMSGMSEHPRQFL